MTTALQLLLCALALPAGAPILDKQAQLDAQTFWDNRDWDWYQANIPFFECPDAEITTFEVALPPPGNLALNMSGQGFPQASASFHDVFGGVPARANDGKTVYRPTPMNRWTSYGSPNATDWLEVDFGAPQEFGRVELCVYDDRGGVQPPASYAVEIWTGTEWREVPHQVKTPATPVGSAVNTVTFPKQTASKCRVVFTHQGKSRSGVSEILVWKG